VDTIAGDQNVRLDAPRWSVGGAIHEFAPHSILILAELNQMMAGVNAC
jgi:hypothetical protein